MLNMQQRQVEIGLLSKFARPQTATVDDMLCHDFAHVGVDCPSAVCCSVNAQRAAALLYTIDDVCVSFISLTTT